MHKWLDVATLVKTKGINGGLVAYAASGLPFLLSENTEVYIVPPKIGVPRVLKICEAGSFKDSSAVVFFEGVSSLNQAQDLVGCHCLIDSDDKAMANTVYSDFPFAGFANGFIGWHIESEDGYVGEIVDQAVNPMQITLTIRTPDDSIRMVPLADELIISIDEDERGIKMLIPDGLLDI